MGICASAVAWALAIASDNSHGYDQTSRWGPDYDCSSLIIQAYENAGVPVKTNGATYTGDMVNVFKACGFVDVTSSVDRSTGSGMKVGDVCWVSGHTEMVSKAGYMVGAHINENGETTGGATGDQTGNEISERTYYNYPWTYVLRYPEVETVDKSDVTTKNAYLSLSEMQINARYINQELSADGWTLNAIAGLLGNAQRESTINSGLWQSMDEGNTSLGLGLVQWTPASTLISWAEARGDEPTDIDTQLDRLRWELANGEQYYETESYPLNFSEYTKSTMSPEYLASVFLHNYERAGVSAEEERRTNARYWYDYLLNYSGGGSEPDDPTPDYPDYKPRRHSMSLLLMYMATKGK